MNEKMVIVGYRDVSFKDDKTGKLIEGRSYYYNMEGHNVVGVMAGKIFVGISALADMKYTPGVSDTVFVSYNRYGKPAGFTKA